MGQSARHCPAPMHADTVHASPYSHRPFPHTGDRSTTGPNRPDKLATSRFPRICSLDTPGFSTTGTTDAVKMVTVSAVLGTILVAILKVVMADAGMPTAEASCIGVNVAASFGSTTAEMLAMHSFCPPHTPQLSTMLVQHTPDGGRCDVQHVPRASTTNPVPSHTPQGSTLPDTQQRPRRSITLPSGQHRPVVASKYPKQQVPWMSRMPSVQGTLVPVSSDSSRGTSHSAPPHPGPQSHVALSALHVRRVLWQSKSVKHQHVASVTQGMVPVGFGPVWEDPTQFASGTWVRPSLPTQFTARDWVPGLRVHESLAPMGALQMPHGPTAQLTILLGHGNRLQGRVLSGRVNCRDVQEESCSWLTAPLRRSLTHLAGEAVDQPQVASDGPMHFEEQLDQSSLTCQNTGLHGSLVQGSTMTGGGSARHRDALTIMLGASKEVLVVTQRTLWEMYPGLPFPQGALHADVSSVSHMMLFAPRGVGDELGDLVLVLDGDAVSDGEGTNELLALSLGVSLGVLLSLTDGEPDRVLDSLAEDEVDLDPVVVTLGLGVAETEGDGVADLVADRDREAELLLLPLTEGDTLAEEEAVVDGDAVTDALVLLDTDRLPLDDKLDVPVSLVELESEPAGVGVVVDVNEGVPLAEGVSFVEAEADVDGVTVTVVDTVGVSLEEGDLDALDDSEALPLPVPDSEMLVEGEVVADSDVVPVTDADRLRVGVTLAVAVSLGEEDCESRGVVEMVFVTERVTVWVGVPLGLQDAVALTDAEGVSVTVAVRLIEALVLMDGVKDREGVKLCEPDCVMDPVEDGDMVGDAVTLGVLVTLAELVQDGEGDEVVVGVRELDTDGVKDGLVVAERDVVGVGDTVAVTVAVTLAVTVALTDADRETEGDKDLDGVTDAVGVVDEDRDRVGLPVGEFDAELQAVDPAGAVVPGGHAMGEPVPAGQYVSTGHTPVQVAEARPAVLPYRPAGHDEQGDKLMPPRLYLPASHKYMESSGLAGQ